MFASPDGSSVPTLIYNEVEVKEKKTLSLFIDSKIIPHGVKKRRRERRRGKGRPGKRGRERKKEREGGTSVRERKRDGKRRREKV